jgi:hypothetical protein
LSSARQKVLDKEAVADVQFAERSLPSATLGKAFAECKIAFAVCLRHMAKELIPIVYKKAKGEAHLGKEWDSDCSSSDSDNEGLAATAFNKSSLFPNERHTCLMAKEKKVCNRNNATYDSSSDDESSDEE